MKIILFATAALVWATAAPAFAEDAVGNWSGAIDGHLISLVHIEQAAGGTLTGTFASHEAPLTAPDGRALKSPIAHVAATADHLSFTVPGNGGLFDGRWDDAGKAWVGTFQWGEGGYKSKLDLSRTDMQSLPAAATPVAYAHPEDETRALDQLVQAYADQGRFMGSVLVMQDEKVLLDKGYGSADIAHALPDTPQTAYRIGSITKQFTAAAILLLQDRGKLKVSDPIKTYLPDAPAAWDHITLFNLLTHTSGLVRDAGPDGLADDRPAGLVARLHDQPLQFVPGETWSYSNAGYGLLGLVIEKISGQAYGDFVRDNLFVPTGMAASAFETGADPRIAVGYQDTLRGPVAVPAAIYKDLYAGGGIVSTTHDLALWQTALLSGKLLSPAALKLMTTPFKADYGMGVWVRTPDGHIDITHGGSLPGFITMVHYELDDHLSIIVLGNNERSTETVADSLQTIAHGLPGRLPPQPAAVKASILEGYVGAYAVAPGVTFVVTLENGQLMAESPQIPKVALYARSDTVFYTNRTDNVTLEFVTTPGGSVNAILHRQGQPDLTGKRQ